LVSPGRSWSLRRLACGTKSGTDLLAFACTYGNPIGAQGHGRLVAEARHTAASLAIIGDRLDVVADAMDAARASALADVERMCNEADVVELREARNPSRQGIPPGAPGEIRTRALPPPEGGTALYDSG
jgi:hypothetical protein